MAKRRVQTNWMYVLVTLVFMLLLTLIQVPPEVPANIAAATVDGPYMVSDVVDGDTIKVVIEGETSTVRLLGIDTPETVHPNKQVECYGKEASARLQELEGTFVFLQDDQSQGDSDRYGRLLRYIYDSSGVFVNRMMIDEGYAYEYTYNTPYFYQEAFIAAERRAEELETGLWAQDTCAGAR